MREQDREFADSSGIKIDSCDAQTTQKLVRLCKIWGYLKYYHPAVAKGIYNWDFQLFRMMPQVLEASSKMEEEKILCDWIQKLGDVQSSENKQTISQDSVKMYPDISWIEDTGSLGEISKHLLAISLTERNESHYYVNFENQPCPVFTHEGAYPLLDDPDTGYRLLALFRYWNVIEYYFPYKYLIGESWDDVLSRFIPLFVKANNRSEYIRVLHKLVASINDTHANLRYTGRYAKNAIPVDVSFVEDKAVVVYNHTNDCQLKTGDILLNIDGETIHEIRDRRLPYISASNYPTKLRNLASELLATNKEKLYITYERDGKVFSDSITCPVRGRWSSNKKNIPLCGHLPSSDYLYLYLGSDIGGEIPEKIDTKGIIIDLRCYPSRKVKGYFDFKQLYPDSIEFAKFTVPSISQPGLFRFTDTYTVGEKNDEYFKGKKIILVNELTQSHAEFMAMKYRCAPNSVVIGSTTSGADGNVSNLYLPGNISTSFSGLGVYYPNGEETQRVGIVPDIVVKPTIKGIRKGQDEVLVKAIELIKNDSSPI